MSSEERSESSKLPTDDLIEIDDPQIDPDQIMAEIRRRIQKRRQELGYEPQRFISYGGAQFPERPDDLPYDPDFYNHLERANKLYLDVETEIDLQPSAATRVPILGQLWQFIREQAHNLSIYYVNRAVVHQSHVDREIIGVLNKLAVINLEQQREMIKLQQEIEALRAQIEK
jgi:hypothetical protein